MSIPTILVTGGAGYIGSIIALTFAQSGYQVIILDDEGAGKKKIIVNNNAKKS